MAERFSWLIDKDFSPCENFVESFILCGSCRPGGPMDKPADQTSTKLTNAPVPNPYYIYQNGKFIGPMKDAEVNALILKRQVTLDNFVFDCNHQCLFRLGDLGPFQKWWPEPPQINFIPNKIYLCPDHEVLGPFSEDEVQTLINKGEVSVYDYIFIYKGHAGPARWSRIVDTKECQHLLPVPPKDGPRHKNPQTNDPGNIVVVNHRQQELGGLPTIMRRFPRAPYSAAASISYDKYLIRGQCSDIGEGGCFIIADAPTLQLKTLVEVKIELGLINVPIKSQARVVCVSQRPGKKGFGLEFIDIEHRMAREIRNFVNKFMQVAQR